MQTKHKMPKQLLSLLLALTLAFSMAPTVALATGSTGTSAVHPQITTAIDLTNATADQQCDHANLGDPCWSWDNATQTLTLNSVDIETSLTSLTLPAGATVFLLEGSQNRVKTGGNGLYAEGDLEFTGTGSLDLKTTGGRGIWTTGKLTISSGTLVVMGKTYAIAAGSMEISGGKISATTESPWEVISLGKGEVPVLSNGVTSTGAAWDNTTGETVVFEIVPAKQVEFMHAQAKDGVDGTQTTTEIFTVFSAGTTELTQQDFTVTGATVTGFNEYGVVGVTLEVGYGLRISDITVGNGGTVDVQVAKDGYIFTPDERECVVYVGGSTPPPSTGGGGSSGGSTGGVIDNPVGNNGSANKLADAAAAAAKAGNTAATTTITYQNYDVLLKEGIKAINDAAAAAVKGKNVKLSVLANFDRVVDGKLQSRITLNPAALTNVTDKVYLGVVFSETDSRIKTYKENFNKVYSNKVVPVLFDQRTPVGTNMTFTAKLDLSKLNTKNLYVYSFDPNTYVYTLIKNPSFSTDKDGYSKMTVPFGGHIMLVEGPLTRLN